MECECGCKAVSLTIEPDRPELYSGTIVCYGCGKTRVGENDSPSELIDRLEKELLQKG